MKGKMKAALALVLAVTMAFAVVAVADDGQADADTTVVTTFSEFESAMTSAGAGSIQLGGDIAMTSSVTVVGTKTLDLYGKAISGNQIIVYNESGGAALTINDSVGGGSITKSSGSAILLKKQSNLVVNGGTIYGGSYSISSGVQSNVSGYQSLGGNTITINGGTFRGPGNGNIWISGGDSITVNGGTFYAGDNANIFVYGVQGLGGTDITINGGTFNAEISSDGYGAMNLFLTQNGTMKVLGGTFNINGAASATGVNFVVRSGNVTIDLDAIQVSNASVGSVTSSKYGDSSYFNAPHLIGAYYTNNSYGYTTGMTDVSLSYILNGATTTIDAATIASNYVTSSKDSEDNKFVLNHITKTVKFNTDGGSSVDSQTVMYNSTASMPDAPTKEGYTFAGWYSDSGLTAKFDFATAIREDTTVYAKWVQNVTYYTVTFKSDESTVYSTAKVESGKMASAPSADPTLSGSRFLGWYTSAGVTSVTEEKYDFSTKITSDLTLYAGWIATCTISLPDSIDNCTLSVYGTNTVNVSTGSFSFVVTPADGYSAIVTISQDEDIVSESFTTATTITVSDLSMNAAVYVMLTAADGSYTETSKTITENTDGTTTTINTTVETTSTGNASISETTTTTDSETTTTKTEATVTDTTATLTVVTSSTDVTKVTETIVYAITEAAEATGTTAVDIDVTVATKAIELPKAILNNENIRSLTVNVNTGSANSAKISIPTDALAADDMADTISLSVTSSTSKPSSTALKGSSAIAAFDLGLTGTNTTEFSSDVSISYGIELPTGAKNVRAYCIDTGEFVKASYTKGTADFDVPHFSAWTIVYDKPTVVVDDDDDILFILEQQKKAQEAASSQTTSEDNSGEEAAVIIAAAAVAGAMLACAFFAFRKS